MTAVKHAALGDHGGTMRHRTELTRDHRCDLATRQPLAPEFRGDARRMAPGKGELVHILGLINRIAELDAAFGAQPQQIARRERANDLAGLVGDAEMAHLEPVHAADRQIGERIGRNGGEWLAHRLLDRPRERGAAVCRQCTHDVAFGDDPGVRGRSSGLPDE